MLEQDSLALLALYENTNGPNWVISWDTTADVSTWQGVSIQNQRVTGLSLPSNQLSGPLPAELGQLVKLTVLDMSGNQISGTIPTNLGNLDSLIVLNLSNNELQGAIPSQLQNLNLLVTLTLSNNQLTGQFPVGLTTLDSLQVLDISSNSIQGQIPMEIGQLSTLNAVNFSDNLFSGPIPAEIGNLQALTTLSLASNQLDSIIPASIANLIRLRVLNLSNNSLTGGIPTVLAQLKELTNLNLSQNQLGGSIPGQLSELSVLRNLSLQGNGIAGTVPFELGNLDSLRVLNLSGNQLTDSIPNSFLKLLKLTTFNIAQNRINKLPNLSGLPNLLSLSVGDNLLTFEDLEPNVTVFDDTTDYSPQAPVDIERNLAIPIGGTGILYTTVGGTQNLYRWLRDTIITDFSPDSTLVIENFQEENSGVYTCEIINQIVPGLVLIRRPILVSQAVNIADSLALLKLFETTNGPGWLVPWKTTLPVSQWSGVSLSQGRVVGINLSNNQLRGYLPSEIELLSDLTDLRLSVNRLSDTIPRQLGNLPKLEILTLNSNELSGSVPSEIFDLDSIKIVYLNDNLLTELPLVPKQLQELRVFNNYLTFSDLEGNTEAAQDFLYAPQLKRPLIRDTIDQGGNLTLEIPLDIGGTANSYYWIRNAADTVGTDSTYLIQNATYRDFGEYRIAVSNAFVDSLTLEFPFLIEVDPISPQIISPEPYCLGDTLVFLQTEDDAQLTVWYQYPDLISPIDSGKSITYQVRQDRDTLYVTNIAGNLESPATSVVIILRPTIWQNEDTLFTSSGGVRYQWFFKGEPIAGAEESYYVRQESGEGLYQVTIFTQEGCSATSNGFGLVTGVEPAIPVHQLSIYPNPANAKLVIVNLTSDSQYRLYGPNGTLVDHGAVTTTHPILDLAGLASGMYLLKLENQSAIRVIKY